MSGLVLDRLAGGFKNAGLGGLVVEMFVQPKKNGFLNLVQQSNSLHGRFNKASSPPHPLIACYFRASLPSMLLHVINLLSTMETLSETQEKFHVIALMVHVFFIVFRIHWFQRDSYHPVLYFNVFSHKTSSKKLLKYFFLSLSPSWYSSDNWLMTSAKVERKCWASLVIA